MSKVVWVESQVWEMRQVGEGMVLEEPTDWVGLPGNFICENWNFTF